MKLEGQNQKKEAQKFIEKEKQGLNEKQASFSKQQNPNQSIPSVHKPIKIYSSAYPIQQGEQLSRPQSSQNPNIINPIKKQQILTPQIESQVHFKLQQINFNPENHHQPIKIRDFREQDLSELKKLQNEWFPLKYSDSFYKKIINKQCYCIIAETKIRKKAQLNDQNETNQNIIVGAAVFEVTDSEGYVYKSWTQSFMSLLSTVEDSIYIMTLGVIDEFRKMGVGKMLVNRIIQIGNKYQNIKLVSLHVISYNKSAICFYQKMGFTNIETLNNFYHVGRKQYDGQFYGIFINEGILNTGWSLKLRKLLK